MSDEQLRQYEALRKLSIEASEAFHAYKREIAKTCDHPAEYVDDWCWEHDNGYGVQRWVNGKRCRICGATKPYATSSSWAEKQPTGGY